MLKLPIHRPPFVLCMLAKNINTQVYHNCWFTSIIIFVHRFRTAFFIHKWTTLAQTIQMYITTSQRSVQWRKYKRKHMKSHTDTLTNTIIAVSHAMAWTSEHIVYLALLYCRHIHANIADRMDVERFSYRHSFELFSKYGNCQSNEYLIVLGKKSALKNGKWKMRAWERN